MFREDTASYADDIVAEATHVKDLLAGGHYGQFDVISASLRLAISEKVRRLRDLRQRHESGVTQPATRALDEMDELLELFTISREYLKTVYIRSEYIDLSQGLLYIGLPTAVLTYMAAQLYTPTIFPGERFGIERRLLFVSAAVTNALAPFALLIAYVFRLAALSRSTLFIGPFAARSGSTGQSNE